MRREEEGRERGVSVDWGTTAAKLEIGLAYFVESVILLYLSAWRWGRILSVNFRAKRSLWTDSLSLSLSPFPWLNGEKTSLSQDPTSIIIFPALAQICS